MFVLLFLLQLIAISIIVMITISNELRTVLAKLRNFHSEKKLPLVAQAMMSSDVITPLASKMMKPELVGGLEHQFYFPINIGNNWESNILGRILIFYFPKKIGNF